MKLLLLYLFIITSEKSHKNMAQNTFWVQRYLSCFWEILRPVARLLWIFDGLWLSVIGCNCTSIDTKQFKQFSQMKIKWNEPLWLHKSCWVNWKAEVPCYFASGKKSNFCHIHSSKIIVCTLWLCSSVTGSSAAQSYSGRHSVDTSFHSNQVGQSRYKSSVMTETNWLNKGNQVWCCLTGMKAFNLTAPCEYDWTPLLRYPTKKPSSTVATVLNISLVTILLA